MLKSRRLARIRAQCAKAAGTSSSKYYTEEAVLLRLELMEQPAVLKALDRLWAAANSDARDQILDRSECRSMVRLAIGSAQLRLLRLLRTRRAALCGSALPRERRGPYLGRLS